MKSLVINVATVLKECDLCRLRQAHHIVARMVFCLLALIATVSCSTTRVPVLTQDEVIGISNRAVKDHNYNLGNYEDPEATYEYAKNDNEWWVFYRLKPKQPLHHMSVFVHDKTKRVKFYAPE